MFFRIFKRRKPKPKQKYSYEYFVNHYGKEEGERLYYNRKRWSKSFRNSK